MSDDSMGGNSEARARLLPVVAGIAGTYVAIITVAYFVGNFIYQIP